MSFAINSISKKAYRLLIGCLALSLSVSALAPQFNGPAQAAGGKLVKPGATTPHTYTSQPQYNPYSNNQGAFRPLQGRVLTAPSGSVLSATMQSSVSSATAHVGDRYNASLASDLNAGTGLVLPAGSQLEAQVVSVTKPGYAGRNGVLDVRFTTAILPNGQRVPMSGKLQTEDNTGVLRGGSIKSGLGKAALRTGVGAGLGAALGTAMGPLSGGRVGRGAVYGTALGGGLGLLSSAANKGADAVLPSGQPLNIILDQPLTVGGSPSSNSSYGGGYDSNSYNSQPLPPVNY